jgi:NAD(P)-dependent dehydrogenase (short-subunit alcohol dehydrogenase family)
VGRPYMAYSTSKTTLNALTAHYARSLAETSIKVNGAAPGHVATDFNGFRGSRTPEQGAAVAIRWHSWIAMGQPVLCLKTTCNLCGESQREKPPRDARRLETSRASSSKAPCDVVDCCAWTVGWARLATDPARARSDERITTGPLGIAPPSAENPGDAGAARRRRCRGARAGMTWTATSRASGGGAGT